VRCSFRIDSRSSATNVRIATMGRYSNRKRDTAREGPADGEREIDCERYRLRRRATILDSVRLYGTADPHQVRDVYYEVRGDQLSRQPGWRP